MQSVQLGINLSEPAWILFVACEQVRRTYRRKRRVTLRLTKMKMEKPLLGKVVSTNAIHFHVSESECKGPS